MCGWDGDVKGYAMDYVTLSDDRRGGWVGGQLEVRCGSERVCGGLTLPYS